MKRLPRELTTVTAFSKLLALILFILLPLFAFYAGMEYQARLLEKSYPAPTPTPIQSGPTPDKQIMCTQEALLCPDGSYVGRTGPNCEFSPCPKNVSNP